MCVEMETGVCKDGDRSVKMETGVCRDGDRCV